MEVIVAVLKDLYTFAIKYRLGFLQEEKNPESHIKEFAQTITNVSDETKRAQTQQNLITKSLDTPLPTIQNEVYFQNNGYVYTPDAFLHALPTRMFDGVIAQLKYGESLHILNSQGKWLNVEWKGIRGWMHMDDITQSSVDLNPQFSAGEIYDHTHASTIKLRTLIDDDFHATQLELPLQDIEYVTYMLYKRGMRIAWSNNRPRVAGTWQKLLKGALGVHLGVNPKSDTIMEYINSDNTGHVCYVESVYPDGALTVSEIGYPHEGVYSERTLSKDEWKELRPIFVEIA